MNNPKIDPKTKDLLTKFTLAAKTYIYDPDRFKMLLKMLGTEPGAIMAVQTVISAVEKAKPIPPSILKLLAINVYVVMVDMAQRVTKIKAAPEVMMKVIGKLMSQIVSTPPGQKPPVQQPGQPAQPAAPQQAQQATQMPPQGIINSNLGA
jgi:hypothetical protein